MRFIPDAWYSLVTTIERAVPMLNEVNAWATYATIWGGLLGQTLFLGLYATRPWRAYQITKALMLKSIAMWLILLLSSSRLVARGLTPRQEGWEFIIFQLLVDAVVLGAIWYQFIVLVKEVRRGGDGPHLGEADRVVRRLS
jgi:hypothetical protein